MAATTKRRGNWGYRRHIA